jgi:hypothetical protein
MMLDTDEAKLHNLCHVHVGVHQGKEQSDCEFKLHTPGASPDMANHLQQLQLCHIFVLLQWM